MTFRPEPVDIATAVREAQDLRALAERKRIRFEAEEDPTIGLVMLDPHRLRQVLFNYLSNALKFTPDEGRVTVRVRAEGAQYFRLAVEDTGLGIRPEELELPVHGVPAARSGRREKAHGYRPGTRLDQEARRSAGRLGGRRKHAGKRQRLLCGAAPRGGAILKKRGRREAAFGEQGAQRLRGVQPGRNLS